MALTVYFPPGVYSITSALTWHDCNMIGDSPNNTVRIVWNGSAGGTAITKPTATWGGSSHGIMEGINFRDGANEPATWLDLTANSIDKQFQLHRVHFIGCTSDAIKIASWVNLHWTNLRWDEIGGYIIRCTPAVSQNLSTFVVDKFTYDHSRASGVASGMVMIDNSANAANLGTFEFSNGRVEINTAWASEQALFHMILIDGAANARSLGLALRNVTYQDAASMASDCALYRDTANTTGSETLILDNCKFGIMSTLLGGTWPTAQYLPAAGNIGYMSINAVLVDSSL